MCWRNNKRTLADPQIEDNIWEPVESAAPHPPEKLSTLALLPPGYTKACVMPCLALHTGSKFIAHTCNTCCDFQVGQLSIFFSASFLSFLSHTGSREEHEERL